MKVLITGGSGFIGSCLTEVLLAKGHEVLIFDKVVSRRFPHLCLVGNVCDRQAVDQAVKGVDLVYHLAAEHRDDVSPVSLYYEVNVQGTQNLAAACTSWGVTRLIFTSSVAVYGLNAPSPTEEFAPNPFNDYGRSKLQAEEVLRHWAGNNPQNSLTIVRPTVIFGEGNRGNVYNLVKQIASGHFVMVGTGVNRKSMGFVNNIASFLGFLDSTGTPGVAVYNYADKPDLSMSELVAKVRAFSGKDRPSYVRIPYWLGLAGGALFDVIGRLTGKKLPVSSVRVKKFCATTTISVERLRSTGFTAPFTLEQAIDIFLDKEFGANTES